MHLLHVRLHVMMHMHVHVRLHAMMHMHVHVRLHAMMHMHVHVQVCMRCTLIHTHQVQLFQCTPSCLVHSKREATCPL